MNVNRTRAIVLRRTNYGEADRIVQFLTPSGKVSALARGVRREKSKLAGGVELLAVVDVTLHKGKGELLTLTSARNEHFFGAILRDYDRLEFAYYVLKDTARMAELIDEEAFFDLLEQTLDALNTLAVSVAVTELCYRLKMAAIVGQGANLVRDVDGVKLSADGRYQFSMSDGGFVARDAGEYTAEHIKILRLASVAAPKTVQNVNDIDDYLQSCLVVSRAAHE